MQVAERPGTPRYRDKRQHPADRCAEKETRPEQPPSRDGAGGRQELHVAATDHAERERQQQDRKAEQRTGQARRQARQAGSDRGDADTCGQA